jgi:hypothetical protein
MLMEFQNHLTFENVYFWTNIGILPFWLMLIIIPNSKFTHFFLNSIILPLILASAYLYTIYQAIVIDDPFSDIFKIYLDLDNLYTLFATESFLLIFWLHFIAINLFLGTWISKDSLKYNLPKIITIIALILVYLSGPFGLVFYWLFRVFYSKRLSFHD